MIDSTIIRTTIDISKMNNAPLNILCPLGLNGQRASEKAYGLSAYMSTLYIEFNHSM
ncbi:hypothetical protein BURCENBC7_AP4060 [Burkholderia cenocepacia BC7]|nr:hypothetical protein BURCENK562V_C5335 [Burkholderia cenocepacia K56-2Valvano]ERI29474.1 hypothetical protein BURCENBC7_AP4060 [Burkholderia cenocepacia BC7]